MPYLSFIAGSPNRIQLRRTSISVMLALDCAAACPIVVGVLPNSSETIATRSQQERLRQRLLVDPTAVR